MEHSTVKLYKATFRTINTWSAAIGFVGYLMKYLCIHVKPCTMYETDSCMQVVCAPLLECEAFGVLFGLIYNAIS